MIVSILAAVDEQGGIGYRNRLPWHLSSDLKRFKSLTMGHHVIMGRNTYESIGRPLPGRTMLVITRRKAYSSIGCLVVQSLTQGLELAASRGENESFVIGGGDVFAQALPLARRIYLTRVHTVAKCDVFFPKIDEADWQVISETSFPASERDDFPTTFKLLEKRVRRK